MKLPADSVIALEKITHYLLVKQARGDKSAFLALAGYSSAEPLRLLEDLRRLLQTQEATLLQTTRFGSTYVVRGELTGPNGRRLRVRTGWITDLSGVTRFITLIPDRGSKPK